MRQLHTGPRSSGMYLQTAPLMSVWTPGPSAVSCEY